MRRTRRSARERDADKLARVEQVVEGILQQRAAGVEIDETAVIEQHPELEPELGRRLRALRAMQEAARQVRERSSPEAMIGAGDVPLQEGLQFLRATLTNYEILEPISYGGQGVVYRAIQRATRRTVAIKVLLDGPLASEHQRRRFMREVELTSRLQHPNIVALYESDVVRGRVYCALEYVEGVPLDDYVLLHGLATTDVVRLFATVVRAVSYAHQQGIIHRDLNPANVLVDLDGVPRVLDFGLAKDVWTGGAARDEPSLTMTGQVVGTLPYLSPEQAGAQDGAVDVRSDIYSLGVMLFELLTGGFPYPIDGSPAEVRANIVSREPLTLRKVIAAGGPNQKSCADLPTSDLEAIVLKALSKDKQGRYQSAASFADDLERCLAGDVVEARADRRYYLLQKAFRKYRAVAMMTGLLLLIVGGAAAAVTVLWSQARSQRDNARSIARIAIGTLDDVITRVDDSVRPLAGGAKVRDELLNDVVVGRLALLAPLVESDAAMEDLRAALYEKQGDIAYARGSFADAARSYERFLDLAAEEARAADSTDERLSTVARAQRKLAGVSSAADDRFRQAIALGKALVTDRPDDLAAKYDLSTTRVEYGRHLYLCGDYEAARQQLEAARAVAEPLVASTEREERWVELLARTYGWQGDVARALGDGGRSVASLTEAVTLCRELSAAQPADVERRHEVLIACAKLGWVLRHEGYTDDAEDAFAEAASVGEYLTSVDPMIAAWTHDLLGVKYGLAQLYLSQDDPQRAQVNCEAAVALAQQLISREPTNPGWRADLAFSHDLRGQVFLQLGQLDRARDDFETALCIREGLLTESPDDLAALKELCASHAQLGFCWLRLLDEEQALEHLQRAHAIAEMLCAQQPSVTQRAIDSISAKVNLATGHMEFCSPENNAQAEALLQDAAAFLEDPRRAAGLSGLTGTRSSLMQAISESFAELSDCLDLEEMSEVDREAGVE